MKVIKKQFLKNLSCEDGQSAVEVCLIIAGIVLFLAAAMHGFLPHLATGFMGMATEIGGPVP
ncbi:Flp family type IVb pilin [Desulfogranum japonicum]|uniref:Flp family type IVb pilin n=1 Tax=Desulfogranum japonicum TaxID=231447 RepID=UPI00041924DD|nr:hypothetical protein [Desulfogranum japonicum]